MLIYRFLVVLLAMLFRSANPATAANPDSLLNIQIQNATQLFNTDPRAALQVLSQAVKSPEFEASGCAARSLLYHRTGVCHFRLKEYAKALVYFRDYALPQREQCLGKIHAETANTTYNIAMMFRNLGDKTAEASYLRKSIDILENLPSEPTVKNYLSRNYKEAAELFRSQGDLATAKRYLLGSQRLLEQLGTFNGKEKALWDFRWGALHADLKKYPEALAAYQKALAAYTQMDTALYRVDIANCHQEIGLIYLYHKTDLKQAERYCRKAMTAFRQIPGEAFSLSLSYELLGIINKRKAQYDQALQYLNQALALRNKMGNAQLLANAWENIGDVYLAMGKTQKSLQSYAKGAKSPVRVDAIRAGLLRAAVLKKEGMAAGKTQTLQEAMQLYLQIDSLATDLRLFYRDNESKTILLADNYPFYEAAIETAHALYQRQQNPHWLEKAYQLCVKNKAALLMDALKDLEARFMGLPDSLRAREQAMRQECQVLLANGSSNFESKRLYYQHFIQKLEDRYPAYYQLKYQSARPLQVEAIQQSLSDDAALLEFFKGQKSIYAFLIVKGSGLQMVVRPVPDGFDSACLAFRAMAESTGGDTAFANYPAVAGLLFQTLLESVLPLIPVGTRRLGIIADGNLVNLPLDLLPTTLVKAWEGTQTPLLIKRFALSQGFSSQWLIYNHQNNKNKQTPLKNFGGFGLEYDEATLRALMSAGLSGDTALLKRNIGKLYYSDDEVKESATLLHGEAWLNGQATKARFMQDYQQYRILHFAMHGLLNTAVPLQSSLVFACSEKNSDFKLHLAEIFGLAIPAQLAVLSACNTYTGPSIPGEGLNSLALAFAHAGCPSIIANQWSASDQSSKTILLQFYKYLSEGMPKDVALQKAKLDYLGQSMPVFSQPSYWANLVVIGDVSPLFSPVKGEQKTRRFPVWLSLLLFAPLLFGGYAWRRRAAKIGK